HRPLELLRFLVKRKAYVVVILEIRPFRNGWKCFEAPGVEPVFLNQEQAIDYAKNRACFRSGEVCVLDCDDAAQCCSPFNETSRRL
ncbi:MAG: hypothetical protein DME76_17965, partial [Verrucomicrobia bacterium]